MLSEHHRGGGRLHDRDGDGQLEFVERVFGGARPHCCYRIHKLNPQQHKAYQFFEGRFSLFRPLAEYLVTSSITEQDLLYSVQLRGPIDGSATPTGRITRPVVKGWEQANLPHAEL